jgi:hypothetical protein
MAKMNISSLLLTSALYSIVANPAAAQAQSQTQPQPTEAAPANRPVSSDNSEMEVVVVRGSRLPESVPGDVKPELSIGTFEIRTTGATSLPELLATILPQTQSGRRPGTNRPILLVNARRVADFSEIRSIPVHAIRRVEVYPEEVALRYGFPADQKVVNLILVGQFNIIGVTGGIGQSAEGARDDYSLSFDGTQITTNGRSTFSWDGTQTTGVSEEDLGISLSPSSVPTVRTLLPESQSIRFSGALGRSLKALGEQGYGTIGIDVLKDQSESVIDRINTGTGSGTNLLRETTNNNAKVSLTTEAMLKDMRWSGIFSAYTNTEKTAIDRLASIQADRADQTLIGASFDGNISGPLKAFAAGPGAFSLNGQLATSQIEASFRRGINVGESDIDRTRTALSGSLSVPLANRRRTKSQFGDVSITINAGLSDSSDFGGSGLWGVGLNWSPINELQVSARYDASEELPTLAQLGGPLSSVPSASVYDVRTNSSLRLDLTTGGNLTLLPEKRTDFTLGATFAPLQLEGLNLSATYSLNETDDYIGTIGVNTRAVESAFSSRYTRNNSGALTGVDNRPLNLGTRTTETLSLGLSFTRNFGQAPQFLRDIVELVRKAQDENPNAPPGPGGLPAGLTPPPGFKPPPGGSPPDFNQIMQAAKIPGGRWNIGLNYAYIMDDTLVLNNSGARLNLLNGGAFNTDTGARRKITFDGGINYRGIGGRLAANWRSDSEIATGYGNERLFVDDQLTLDLSLFASTDLMPQLNMMVPFLRGAQIRFDVDNLTDSEQKVTTSAGAIPTPYQSRLIDPTGRAFKLSLKKQF